MVQTQAIQAHEGVHEFVGGVEPHEFDGGKTRQTVRTAFARLTCVLETPFPDKVPKTQKFLNPQSPSSP